MNNSTEQDKDDGGRSVSIPPLYLFSAWLDLELIMQIVEKGGCACCETLAAWLTANVKSSPHRVQPPMHVPC